MTTDTWPPASDPAEHLEECRLCLETDSLWTISWEKPTGGWETRIGHTLEALLSRAGIRDCGLSLVPWPRHDCGLSITRDEHKGEVTWLEDGVRTTFEATLRDAVLQGDVGVADFSDAAALARAVEADSAWSVGWFPETPGSHHAMSAPTLDELAQRVRALRAWT